MDTKEQATIVMEDICVSVFWSRTLSSSLSLADRFDRPLDPREAVLCDRALLDVLRTAPVEVRKHLSCRLAGNTAGPERCVSHLALDLDPAIAGPVLQSSILVSDLDLITVARTRSQDHLALVAERRGITAPIADAVVTRGSWRVLRLLSANRTATLSQHSLRRLCTLSQADGHIAASLMTREDVPLMTRSRLRDHFEHLTLTCLPWLRGEGSSVGPDQSEQPPDVGENFIVALGPEKIKNAASRVDKLALSRPVTALEVSRYLVHDNLAEALVVICRLAGESPDTLVQHLKQPDPIAPLPLIVMRAANLTWEVVENVVAAVDAAAPTQRSRRSTGLSPHREMYRKLTAESAKSALQQLRAAPNLTIIAGGRTMTKQTNHHNR